MCSGSYGVGVLHRSAACRMRKCSGSILSSIKLFGLITWAMERSPAPCGTLGGVDSRLRQRLRTQHRADEGDQIHVEVFHADYEPSLASTR